MNEKIKLIIVDDEYLERNLLKNCIEWDKLDIEIVGEASNADEALKLIEQNRPDIIFTDINMPVMNGLKFSKMVKEKYPEIKIVVVTGFDDFQNAQKSIKMGISDFIVKPISDDEVYKSVLKLKEQIEKRRSDNEEYSALRRQFLENLPYIREKFYNELILGEFDEKKEYEHMMFLGINLRGNFYQVAAIECIQETAENEETRFLNTIQLLNKARSFFRGMIVFLDTMSRIIVINNDENTDLYEKCEGFMDKNMDADICIGVGTIKDKLNQISISYKEALEALNYKVAVGRNSVILHSNIRASGKKIYEDTESLTEELTFSIKSRLTDKAIAAADAILDSIDIKSEGAVKAIRIAVGNIAALCLKTLLESGKDIDFIYKENIRVNSEVMKISTMPEAREYVKALIKETIDISNSVNQHKISDMVQEVKKYIDEHYNDHNLSLTSVAGKMYLNPSYLSRTFKKEAGMSFIEYLTSVRMEKAMELLRKDEYRAFEVAELVGIPDANYFCSCFKKYYGVNVSDFKRADKKA
ncbi:AraC family transcriptional regulator [[Clostridium] cellulosi]|uniref:Stage 0 sporulation protein A homolog n=1 Tax=[Clostridium] cellulosi TaxID=29343 RepID=A0A078KPX7_9FIRM|nr:AraC family transcriptional regulator [[Clostridium] cellulosi]